VQGCVRCRTCPLPRCRDWQRRGDRSYAGLTATQGLWVYGRGSFAGNDSPVVPIPPPCADAAPCSDAAPLPDAWSMSHVIHFGWRSTHTPSSIANRRRYHTYGPTSPIPQTRREAGTQSQGSRTRSRDSLAAEEERGARLDDFGSDSRSSAPRTIFRRLHTTSRREPARLPFRPPADRRRRTRCFATRTKLHTAESIQTLTPLSPGNLPAALRPR
jgi:hypothetical protein